MSNREKWLFDLQGFLVIPGFLTPEEVARLNEAVDASLDRVEVDPNKVLGSSTALQGEGERKILNGVLTLPKPWCDPFRDLIAHRKLFPYLNTLFGRGWRMDHSPHVFIAEKDAAGLRMHGSGQIHFVGGQHYVYSNGVMRCGMIALEYALTDVGPGDGGFCVIPGSHKMNFNAPHTVLEWDADTEVVAQPPHKAGDLIIFSESTTHGTLPWRGEHQRRALLYRYSSKWLNYIDVFNTHVPPDWFSELDDVQRAVLEPPYLYQRPLLADDGTIERPQMEF